MACCDGVSIARFTVPHLSLEPIAEGAILQLRTFQDLCMKIRACQILKEGAAARHGEGAALRQKLPELLRGYPLKKAFLCPVPGTGREWR